MFSVNVIADGMYTCVPINTVGTGENASVGVIAVGKLTLIHVHVTVVTGNKTICKGSRWKHNPLFIWTK